MNKAFWKSRTFWGAVIVSAARIVAAPDNAGRVDAAVQGVGVVLAAVGVRDAIAKNGEGK